MGQRKFFISYRRLDEATAAHVICERLIQRFGADHVFFDVDSIPLGIDFHLFLTEQVQACQVLVAVIGRQWLNIADGQGRRRLDLDDDFVRIEITEALERNIPVVPVLVEGAAMPRADQLPQCLRRLARRNAFELRPGAMFFQQLDSLVQRLEQTLTAPMPQRMAPQPAQVSKTVQIPEQSPARSTSSEVNANRLDKIGDERTGITFVEIPAGEFEMGEENSDRNNERPVHHVRISQRFWLGKYPVSNAEYAKFMKESDGNVKKPKYWDDRRFNQPEQPVVGVSWDEAQVFCQWAGCRLPTEAEWEYACRAGTTTLYSFGDDPSLLGEYAWFAENSNGQTQPVGTKQPNPWDLYDMHGNVWEWCQDRYGEYSSDPQADPTGPQSGDGRVLRGGSWFLYRHYCRSAIRNYWHPDIRDYNYGFRVART